MRQLTKEIVEKAEEDEDLAKTDDQLALLHYTVAQILTDGRSWFDGECRTCIGFTPSTSHFRMQRQHCANPTKTRL